jgi:hypothetical protein
MEFVANDGDVVLGVGAARMPCQLRDLPRRQIAEDLGSLDAQFGTQLADFVIDVDGIVVAGAGQIEQLAIQHRTRLLEIEEVGVHSLPGWAKPRLYRRRSAHSVRQPRTGSGSLSAREQRGERVVHARK